MIKSDYIKKLEEIKQPSVLMDGFIKCNTENDIINLGTAENTLIADEILKFVRNRPGMEEKNLMYPSSFLYEPLLKHIAKLFEDHFGIKNVKHNNICFGSGISYIVEKLGMALINPGDLVLIPKPCYAGFESDLLYCQAKIEYIDLDNLPEKPPMEAKLLILTNPGNPFGDKIRNADKVLDWALQAPHLHVVTDEVYALSNRSGEKFMSIMSLPNADPNRVHLCYGISKDWGLSGFHVGIFYTQNDELFNAVRLASGTYSISSDCVNLLERIFGDYDNRDRLIKLFQERIKKAEEVASAELTKLGVKHRLSENSLFINVDFSKYVHSAEEERQLWMDLLDKYRVCILPDMLAFRHDTPGLFRMIFTVDQDTVLEAISRIGRCAQDLRAKAK